MIGVRLESLACMALLSSPHVVVEGRCPVLGVRQLAVQFREVLAASDPGVNPVRCARRSPRNSPAPRRPAPRPGCGTRRGRRSVVSIASAGSRTRRIGWRDRPGPPPGEARAALGTSRRSMPVRRPRMRWRPVRCRWPKPREIASVPEHEAELLELARTSGLGRSRTRHASCASRRSIPRNCSRSNTRRGSSCTGETTSA